VPLGEWPSGAAEGDPWERFIAARKAYEASDVETAVTIWNDIVTSPGLESRQYLQAWGFLRTVRRQPSGDTAKAVLGAIAEMPFDQAHDVLAAYEDGSCRYLNHTGSAAVIEDRSIAPVRAAVRAWLEAASALVRIIGPWEPPELPPLPVGHMRVMVLTPSGPHFGQGPQQQMMAQAPVRPFVQAATTLLSAVVTATTATP
jgi:hypothetical protein